MATPVWQPGTIYPPGSLVQPASAPPSQPDQVTNGDFEAGNSGWTLDAGFSIGQFGNGTHFQGTWSLQWDLTADGRAINNNATAVVAGQIINASCQVQQGQSDSGDAGALVEVLWYDASDEFISASAGNLIDSGSNQTWKQSSVAATAPAGAAFARFAVSAFRSSGGHELWVDNCSWDAIVNGLTDGLVFRAVQAIAGYSGSSEPVWPLSVGLQVVDNEVTWEAVFASRVTWEATPILVSGSYEPTFPEAPNATVADGTIVWTAMDWRVTQAPQSKVVAIGASKIFAADDDIISFSATVNPLDWTTEEDAGYIPFGLNTYGATPVTALGLYRSNLVAFNSEAYQMWQIDEDPANMAILDASPVACLFPRSVQPVSNDLVMCTPEGVRNIGIAGASTNLQAGYFGAQVDPLVLAKIRLGEIPFALFWPSMGQYWLIFGDEAFVLTMNGGAKDQSWSRYVFPEALTYWAILEGDLYLRAGDLVWRVSDEVFEDDAVIPSVTLTAVQDQSNGNVALTWTALTRRTADNYILYRSDDGGAFNVIYEGLDLDYADATAGLGVSYTYRVDAEAGSDTYASNEETVEVSISPAAYQPVNLDFGTQIVARGAPASFDHMLRETGNTLYDPDDAARKYKLTYTGYPADPPTNNTAIGYAYSADGLTWTKVGQLTLGRASEDPFVVKSGSTYYLYVEDKEDLPFRNIRLYTSTDFATWADQGDVLDIGTGWEATDVSSPTVWIEGSTWYMLYEGRGTNQAGAIGLATSTDGIAWTKSGSNPVLVGQNPTYGYTGPIAWSDGVVPDDIVKVGGTYVLQIHGRKDSTETFYFRAGIATSTDLINWTDALGTQLFAVGAPDASTMATLIPSAPLFRYVFPGAGLNAASEGAGDADWASTVLYITGYEYDATTRFYDLSSSWHTITTVGSTQVDDAQSKYGPSSILFDGAGDRLTVPDSANWSFDSGAFTVEAWVRFAATETNPNVICSQWGGTQRSWVFDYNNNALRFSYSTNGTTTAATLTFAWTQSGGTWFHFALTRDGSGDVRAFVDGVQVGATQAAAVTLFSSTADLWIGAIETSTPANDFAGHMEGLRITKGVARYTANFTAPTAMYPIGPVPAP